MKATGIVRRIDDLGRVVIPKEIRRTLRIREGDPLEIFTDREGEVILKKYSPISELNEFATEYVESLNEAINVIAIVTDRDNIIAVAGGSKKDYINKRVSEQLEKFMEQREIKVINEAEKLIPIINEEKDGRKYSSQVIAPITSHGDPIGAVVLLSKDTDKVMGEMEQKLAETAAGFLGKQMEQ
ncbi:stage V sporulation protein T [Caminicella sporogenes]|uniref:stage V sporulation protein T n=1 Tax=Caminicella sporogenes TaxID=166485 RepID=UPI002541628C|nr:stage V sporulation protein T [Caminicella sporogenes]WIF95676.1 stage V sporulation protein T [Caminicella sporogenes]